MNIASNTLSPLMGSVADAVGVSLERAHAFKTARMNSAQAEVAAKDFESMFLASMLETMFGESVGEEAFGDNETSEIYRGLMMTEYAKQITSSGGIGIADYVKTELLKTQEV